MILNPLQLGVMGAAAAAGLFAGSPVGKPIVRQAAAKTAAAVKTVAIKAAGKPAPAPKPIPHQLEDKRTPMQKASERHGVPIQLVSAIISQESSGNASATRQENPALTGALTSIYDGARRAGWTNAQLATSYGLIQILGATAWGRGYRGQPAGLFDPTTNLEYGMKHLRYGFDYVHDKKGKRGEEAWRLACVYYNGDSKALAEVLTNNIGPVGRNASIYAASVMNRWHAIQQGDL